jgi:hypothetical protein
MLSSLINRKSRFLYPMWMHPARVWRHSEGDNASLLKVRGGNYKGHEGPGIRRKQREHLLLSKCF